jgi:hypothetical protein
VQLSGRQQMLRRMVERMFESEMPKSIMLPALKPSEQNRLKAPLEFVQANADRGWFTLALEPPVSR